MGQTTQPSAQHILTGINFVKMDTLTNICLSYVTIKLDPKV